jgi:hypothetical protein
VTKHRTCGTKQAHATKAAAKAHIGSLIAAGTHKRAMTAYKCPYCHKWHVGHVARRRR